ncbi:exosome complex component RRP41-like [Citrus sinensis]|uniref:Exosome complex component RRP41-like n=2 Tax=Citrus sinensis TaxID=2711 RepID=A0ACB8IU80_CITSI|nr:exosome complex component RRP41-like [Citrus sinensis]
MAAKPSTTTTAKATYSPIDPTRKTRPPIFSGSDVDWLRPDSRGFHQCRPAFFRTGAVNSASGSAYAEFGNTKVIVSVFGPRESKKAMMYSNIGRLNCNVSYTTFATPIRGQGSDHKDFSSMLHKALEGAIILETFPKTTVDVFALVLESGGSIRFLVKQVDELDTLWFAVGDLPVVISCASVALADAGIMMYDLVASVSVSCLGKNLLIDPVLEEESYQDGSLMIACMPSRYEVTQLTVTGEWSTPHFNEAMQLCLDASAKLGKIMRSCLKEAASDEQE